MPSIIYDNFKGGLDLRGDVSMGAANVLFALNNAYSTTGNSIRKRPCLTKTATLEAGTKGLKAAGGVLNTFYESGAIVHANPLFVANKVAHPTLSQPVAKVHYGELFNGFLYCSIEYSDGSVKHHYLDGTAPTYVIDVNCPNTKQVRKINQKIYGPVAGNVRYCKTAVPRDWTTVSDAGSISAGSQAGGSDQVSALGVYQQKLTVFFSDSMQVWTVDSNPANISLTGTSANVGTKHYLSPSELASDEIFLAKQGFRSVALVAISNNLQENDVGSAIDALRPDIGDTDTLISIYYPTLGQLWWIDGTKAYVYSYARSKKLSAWSTYEFPVSISDAAVLAGDLYLRSGDIVYRVDNTVYADDGVIPEVSIDMYYQDQKGSGILKQFMGFDAITRGSPSIGFKFNADDETLMTDALPVTGDMRRGDLYPMEICATSVAPYIRHQTNEAFELFMIQMYYESLGPV